MTTVPALTPRHRELLQQAGRWLIIAFCCWHMLAVAVYSLNEELEQKTWQYITNKPTSLAALKPLVSPYILITSQWQQWNLFAPDPMQRVNKLLIETNPDGRWETLEEIGIETMNPWFSDYQIKLVERLETDRNTLVQNRLLRFYCRDYGLPAGQPMRLTSRYYVLPTEAGILQADWWQTWEPQWRNEILITVPCPEYE